MSSAPSHSGIKRASWRAVLMLGLCALVGVLAGWLTLGLLE